MPPLQLPQQLDLRIRKDREVFFRAIADRSDASPISLNDIDEGIESLIAHFPNAAWLNLSAFLGGNFLLQTSDKNSESIPLDDMAVLGLRLNKLKHCPGFENLLSGFSNLTQFRDSMFEAMMAEYCLKRAQALSFNAEYEVRGHLKHPDFEIDTKLGKIVCECKGLDDKEREYSRQLNRLLTALNEAASSEGGIPDSDRLEVHWQGPIRQDFDKTARLIYKNALSSPRGIVQNVDAFAFVLNKKDEQTSFTSSGITLASIIVGTTAVGLSTENQSLRLTTDKRIDRARTRAAGTLIRDAKSQLPESEIGAIFIETLNGSPGVEAAKRRLATTDYSHILAIGVVSSKIDWTYVTSRYQEVETIFGPFGKE